MADVTRNSFQDGKNYENVEYQRGKDVLDAELNENARIHRSRRTQLTRAALGDAVYASDTGGLVTSDDATANKLTVKAGYVVARGYTINIAADQAITGLTTPVADRTDDVYLKLQEVEVSSAVDPFIKVDALGETSVRKQLKFSFVVDEGGAAPPVDTAGELYAGGIKYIRLARVYRQAGVAIVNHQWIVDFRSRSLPQQLAQDRNRIYAASDVHWDGATITFGSMQIYEMGQATYFDISTNFAPANGECFGWLSATAADRMRRSFGAGIVSISGAAAPASGTKDVLTKAAFSAVAAVDSTNADGVFVLGMRVNNQIILRNGVVLNPGDRIQSFGQQNSVAPSSETTYAPLLIGRDYAFHGRTHIDHNGYRMGQVSEKDEHWIVSTRTEHVPLPYVFVAGGGGLSLGRTFSTTNDVMVVRLGDVVPDGATITSLQITYNSSVNTNQLSGEIDRTTLAGVQTTPVSRTVATAIGYNTFDIMVTPTAGHGPVNQTTVAGLDLLLKAVSITPGKTVQIVDVQVTYVMDPTGWTWSGVTTESAAANGDSRSYQDPIAGFNQRHVQLVTTADGVVAGSTVLVSNYDVFAEAGTVYEKEWMLKTGTIDDASHGCEILLGFEFATAQRRVYMWFDNGSPNWQLGVLVGVGITLLDTGVAVAANTVYRVRLELSGTGANSSGLVQTRLFINGALVATSQRNDLPTSDKIRTILAMATGGNVGGPYDVRVGRLRKVWNHLQTQDAL